MALTAYLQDTQRLLQNPAAPNLLYNPADLTVYINKARRQLAGESECIRVLGTIPTIIGTLGPYAFTTISLSGAAGVAGVENVRTLFRINVGVRVWIAPRSWEWFGQYGWTPTALATPGPPLMWSQFAQGQAGTIYVSPYPDQVYSLLADCVGWPIDLIDDTTVEAIPGAWTEAVPYFAAYLALLSSQTGSRMQEAEKMLELYSIFAKRARQFATPEVLAGQYPQNAPSQQATGQSRPGDR